MSRLMVLLVVVCGLVACDWVPNTDRAAYRAKDAIEKHTSWTAEARAEDPVGYLRWSLTEFDRLETALTGRKLAFATQGQKFRREHEAAAVFQAQAAKKLEEIKAAYRAGESANKWPVEISGVTMSQADVQTLIVKTHAELAKLQQRSAPYERAGKIIESRQAQVDKILATLREKRVEVRDKLELAQMQQNLKELEALTGKVEDTLDESLALPTDDALDIDIKDLMALDGTAAVDSATFAEIMKR